MSMSAASVMPKPKYCWDSCVFISLLTNNGSRTPEELARLYEVVDEIDRKEAILVTGWMMDVEVLPDETDAAVVERLDGFLKRSNIVVQNSSRELGKQAAAIRTACRAAGLKMPKAADSTFVAVALAHDCDVLHTFDGPLRKLSGLPEVGGLRIEKPRTDRPALLLGDA